MKGLEGSGGGGGRPRPGLVVKVLLDVGATEAERAGGQPEWWRRAAGTEPAEQRAGADVEHTGHVGLLEEFGHRELTEQGVRGRGEENLSVSKCRSIIPHDPPPEARGKGTTSGNTNASDKSGLDKNSGKPAIQDLAGCLELARNRPGSISGTRGDAGVASLKRRQETASPDKTTLIPRCLFVCLPK